MYIYNCPTYYKVRNLCSANSNHFMLRIIIPSYIRKDARASISSALYTGHKRKPIHKKKKKTPKLCTQ